MKKIFFLSLIILSSVILYAGGLHFGMTGAVKEKVKELDKKVKEKVSSETVQSNFVKEIGVRVEEGAVPYIFQMGDGTFKLFFSAPGGIKSAISSDGLNFTVETGTRIATSEISDAKIVADPTVIKISTDNYRMYFKVQPKSNPYSHEIWTATSTDVHNWSGFQRVYQDNYSGKNFASVPDAILLPDGNVRIFFVEGGTYIASIISQNGDLINFVREGKVLEQAVDPNIIKKADGTYLLFYVTGLTGTFPPAGGILTEAIRCASSTDGKIFTPGTVNLIQKGDTYDINGVYDPSAIELSNGKIRIYYGGSDSNNKMRTLSGIEK